MQRVLDVDGEANRLPLLAELVPVADDVADEIVAVHPFGELGLDIVADAGLDALQVRFDRSEHTGPDQIFLRDQFGDLRTFDDDVEDAAQAATVTAARRGSQADQYGVGIGVDDLAVSGRRTVVRLVDNEQVGGRQLHAIAPHGPRP
jgi:hypothetical protein